jgi:hypothetical protein
MAITHRYTIICDDVRKEDNGKLLIVGMYMGIIAVPQLPFVMPSLTFFQVLNSDRPGHWAMALKLRHLETGRNLVEAHGGMVCQQPGLAVMPVKFGAVQFQAVGPYHFIVEIEGQANDPILTEFSVVLNVPPQVQMPAFPLGPPMR